MALSAWRVQGDLIGKAFGLSSRFRRLPEQRRVRRVICVLRVLPIIQPGIGITSHAAASGPLPAAAAQRVESPGTGGCQREEQFQPGRSPRPRRRRAAAFSRRWLKAAGRVDAGPTLGGGRGGSAGPGHGVATDQQDATGRDPVHQAALVRAVQARQAVLRVAVAQASQRQARVGGQGQEGAAQQAGPGRDPRRRGGVMMAGFRAQGARKGLP